MSKQFLVVGDPVDHSKSPAIHRAAYNVLGLDWTYGRLQVAKNDLRQVLDNAPEQLSGFSVTMPLKEEAARSVQSMDEFARATGAVNTLVRSSSGWAGYNTDVFGVVMAIRESVPAGRAVIGVIGSGATAKSSVAALRLINPKARVIVYARSTDSYETLREFAKSLEIRVSRKRSLRSLVRKSDLTISTLPSGALDEHLERAGKRLASAIKGPLFDVAYNPWPSHAAKVWLASGQSVISGIEMLIWQAVAQIRLFVHGDPNQELSNEVAVVEAMRHAAE
jgi:shikimate dehydrogenase